MTELSGRPLVVNLEDVDSSSVHLVGGKCASLGELRKTRAEVPFGFAVTTYAHTEFLERNRIHERVGEIIERLDHDDLDHVTIASRDARAVVEASPLPETVESAIREAFDDLVSRLGGEPLPVAVRSSATAEDHYTASFAGQLETYLWVVGIEAVLANVLRCWGGLYTPHALTYRHQMGFAEESIMSVGVQQMVDARTAGVMFTMNPVNGDRSKIMIEACWGLGEGVVKGDVNPDRYLIDKVTLEILDRSVADKPRAYRYTPDSDEVKPLEVDPDLQQAPSVSDDELSQLARLGKDIERHYGRPQDIEWAIGPRNGGDDGIHVLQSRAETVWSRREVEPIAADGRTAVDRVIASFIRTDPEQ